MDTKPVGFRPSESLYKAIKAYADDEGVSVGAALRQLVTSALVMLDRWPLARSN